MSVTDYRKNNFLQKAIQSDWANTRKCVENKRIMQNRKKTVLMKIETSLSTAMSAPRRKDVLPPSKSMSRFDIVWDMHIGLTSVVILWKIWVNFWVST